MIEKQNISVAYSPDTDDAFMVLALREGLVASEKYEFSFFSDDIEALNKAALQNAPYDISAISIAAYPAMRDEYIMMPIGASIGEQFGPAIVVREGSPISSLEELAGARIAVPGRYTSAYFAATALLPNFEAVPTAFDQIGPSVLRGEVDAGILIHELQLNCEEQGFRKLGDLGVLWENRFHLPLPLGANAIRRSLGHKIIADLTSLYRQSIQWAMAHRNDTVSIASSLAKTGLEDSLAHRYIDMYVNRRALAMENDVLTGIETLYEQGALKGFCPAIRRSDFIYT